MALYLIGLGLGSLDYTSLKAIREIMKCHIAYLDTYTGLISEELVDWLRKKLDGRLKLACRRDLEDNLEKIVEEARNIDVAILVPGDPLIATTHMSLLVEASRRRTPYKIVHGISIYSAAVSITGLHVYKFGKTTTLPLIGDPAETYMIIKENQERGLHTMILLDTADGGLTIPNALRRLLEAEDRLNQGILGEDTLAIGLSRVGLEDQYIKVGMVKELISVNYPPPPHALIFPGELHFMEVEALSKMYNISEEVVRRHKPARYEKERIRRYIVKTREVMENLKMMKPCKKVDKILEIASSYLEDAERFWSSGELFNALGAITYAEGLLDSLRMMSLIDFQWP
ncbi:MAG: diphthine synthase [Nitrososphaerota archaeon]